MTDKKLKPVIEYYDNGKIKRAYSVDEHNKEQGPYKAYHENDQLKEKCTYKDGKLDGPYEEYYDNGQLRRKSTYKNGYLDSPYEIYDNDGQLKEIIVYEKGYLLDGKKAVEYLKKNYPIKYIELQEIELKEAREKARKEQEEKEARKKTERKGLCARLAQMDKKMPPTQLRQSLKRAEVAKFRGKFPKESVKKKNWLQKLFRGGR